MFTFAGLWATWSDNGEDLRTVAIITTEPNEIVEPVHNRMPVMLEPDEEEYEFPMIVDPSGDWITNWDRIDRYIDSHEGPENLIFEAICEDIRSKEYSFREEIEISRALFDRADAKEIVDRDELERVRRELESIGDELS